MIMNNTELINVSHELLVQSLTTLSQSHYSLELLFSQNPDWDAEVKWQIEEAACKLGFALATLSTWLDEDKKGTTNS